MNQSFRDFIIWAFTLPTPCTPKELHPEMQTQEHHRSTRRHVQNTPSMTQCTPQGEVPLSCEFTVLNHLDHNETQRFQNKEET